MTAPASGALRIFIIATEASGDRLGAALMRELRARHGAVEFEGVGGQAMAAEGLTSPFAVEELSIIGFAAILRNLPQLLRRIRETAAAALAFRPDVLVLVDGPEFTHRVARRVRRRDPAIPIVDYVSPTVWAWRPWRARAMRGYVDQVLAVLPFEPEVHRKLGGPPCLYVGHPLVEQLGVLRPDAREAERRAASPPLIVVLPGSRRGELRRLMPVFGATLQRLAATGVAFDLVLPTLPHLATAVTAMTAAWPVRPRIVSDEAGKLAAFRIARAALVKSGTVTLELALAGVPMVAAYQVSRSEEWIARRLISVSTVILANLVIGENVVPEFLQRDCVPEKLAPALAALLSEGPARRRQVEAFARLDAIMGVAGEPPAARAATAVAAAAHRIAHSQHVRSRL
ncbi:MAG: lipid-A-disaccharide synthase [Xanthobacteraceae bacterium]|nr:MAG: lipid-A-disaccharide synthase [Xanthobacteraceae bacterium]